jgi:hypothetical protein
MTKGEREDLQRLVRQREKVLSIGTYGGPIVSLTLASRRSAYAMSSYQKIEISTIPQPNNDIARIICTAEGHERQLSAGALMCDCIGLSDMMWDGVHQYSATINRPF